MTAYQVLATHKMNSMLIEFIAEFFGTFLLMVCGLSGAATNVLGGHNSVLFIAASYPLGLIIGALYAGPISGAHFNPAISLALALIGKCSWLKVPVYFVAQYLGSLAAAFAVYGIYSESIVAFDAGFPERSAAIFLASPATNISLWPAFSDQVLSTALLALGVLFVGNQKCFQLQLPAQILTVGAFIFSLMFTFNYNAGAILNPARDLSPRIALWLVGYKTTSFSPLSGHFWWLVGIIAPHVGGIVGALVYKFLAKIREEHIENRSIEYNLDNSLTLKNKTFDSNNNSTFD